MGKSYSRERAMIHHAANSALNRQREVVESAGKLLSQLTNLGGRKILQNTKVAPKKSGLGGFIATGLAVTIVAGVVYLAWHVLRTDDDAWVDEEFDVD